MKRKEWNSFYKTLLAKNTWMDTSVFLRQPQNIKPWIVWKNLSINHMQIIAKLYKIILVLESPQFVSSYFKVE